MKKTKEQLMEDLKVHQKNVKSNLIKNNKKLKESLEKKIKDLEQEIENYVEEKAPAIDDKPKVEKPKVEKPSVEKPSVEKPSVEKPSVEKPKVEKAPKVEKPKEKNDKKVAPANAKVAAKFNVGDKVYFLDNETNKKRTGEIKSIVKGSSPGTFNAIIITSNGERKKMRVSKIEKV